jgi:hypothetical protein
MNRDPITPVVDWLLQCLTLEEKASLLAGKNMWEMTQVDCLGIPSLKMTDGPAGARGSKWTYGSLTTFVPCGISLAATWDPALVEKVGTVLGEETRRKGCQVLLAPTMNLSRSPLGGRNFEGYGEDLYLVGAISMAMICGIQSQGVGACMKYFIANDTETRRFNVDQTIDDRTLREVYMKPFVMALDASPWTAMVSYPKINGLHADVSPAILRPLLREELQFDCLVMSDWGGCNDTVRVSLLPLIWRCRGQPFAAETACWPRSVMARLILQCMSTLAYGECCSSWKRSACCQRNLVGNVRPPTKMKPRNRPRMILSFTTLPERRLRVG